MHKNERDSQPGRRLAPSRPVKKITSGFRRLDQAMGGGLRPAALTVLAARTHFDSRYLLMRMVLANLQRKVAVAFVSERTKEADLRQQLVIENAGLEVGRVARGLLSAPERIALAAARGELPWNLFSSRAGRYISPEEIETHIFSYQPRFLVADISPHPVSPMSTTASVGLLQGVAELATIAEKYALSILLHVPLGASKSPPRAEELPGAGAVGRLADTLLIAHSKEQYAKRSTTFVDITLCRLASKSIEPHSLRFKT